VVFHNDLKPNYLTEAIEKACKLSFYFAHFYYFYIGRWRRPSGLRRYRYSIRSQTISSPSFNR
jgi:hypothetical protein